MADAGGGVVCFARELLLMNDLTEVKVKGATSEEAKNVLAEMIVDHLKGADLSSLKNGGFTNVDLEALSDKIVKLGKQVASCNRDLLTIAALIKERIGIEPKKTDVDHRLDVALEQALPRIQAMFAKSKKATIAPKNVSDVKISVPIYPEGMITKDNWLTYIARAIKNEDGNIKRISFLLDTTGNITYQTEDWVLPSHIIE